MPTVSIVVPTYKRAAYLRRMIDSVNAQTYDDWELIIVDGDSHDGTSELVNGCRARFGGRLVFIEQENRGCCTARNTGIEAARGEFVAFLDSDDEFLPTKLERQIELFKLRPELGLVYCDYSYRDLSGGFCRSVFDTKSPIAREVPGEVVAPGLHVCAPNLFDYLIREYFIATIVGVVRRSVLAEDIRFLPQDMYGCEWLFYLEVAARTRAGYVDEPLSMHHFVKGSLSRTSRVRNLIYHRRLLKVMRERFRAASAFARGQIRRQLAETCANLAARSHAEREYGPAVKYFSEALRSRLTRSSFNGLAQSAVAFLLSMGRPGREPLLRFDPHRQLPQ